MASPSSSSTPDFPPPPAHYPPCAFQKDDERRLHEELRQIYNEHSATWDPESRSVWFSFVIDKATLCPSTKTKVTSHPLSRPSLGKPVTWAHFCALRVIFKERVYRATKFIKDVLARYPSADLTSFAFDEGYKVPNEEWLLKTLESDDDEDTKEKDPRHLPETTTMPAQTRSASAKPSEASVGGARRTKTAKAQRAAPPEKPTGDKEIKQEVSDDEQPVVTAPKKRTRLPDEAPKEPSEPAPKRQKKSASTTTAKAGNTTAKAGTAAAKASTVASKASTTAAAKASAAAPKKERAKGAKRGRKPGSVNKPRPEIVAMMARLEALEAANKEQNIMMQHMRAYNRKLGAALLRVRR
ncbi:low temperature requirement A [Purpureocillium lavendulum]|uniref:Low temperature requirement A n=1 Tax=Purpureocillium lavendulum TaxID=1247861 RepID=A0AB34FVG9_9HYPO|nr:low temperature requirement A [Purpureocillium lavendulum]